MQHNVAKCRSKPFWCGEPTYDASKRTNTDDWKCFYNLIDSRCVVFSVTLGSHTQSLFLCLKCPGNLYAPTAAFKHSAARLASGSPAAEEHERERSIRRSQYRRPKLEWFSAQTRVCGGLKESFTSLFPALLHPDSRSLRHTRIMNKHQRKKTVMRDAYIFIVQITKKTCTRSPLQLVTMVGVAV